MTTENKKQKVLNIVLWIAQGILSLTFAWAGFMKIVQPEKLPFPWVKDNASLVLVTGIIDLLAGIGIVLPAILHVKTKLTLFTAYGIIMLMIAACVFHISRGEAKDIGFNIFMLTLAIFVAWSRQKKVPLANR